MTSKLKWGTILLLNALMFGWGIFTPPSSSPTHPVAVQLAPLPSMVPTEFTSEIIPKIPAVGESTEELRVWAARDRASFLVWVQKHPDDPNASSVRSQLLLQIAETNAVAAVALTESGAATARPVLENLVQQWARQDLSAAYAWVVAQPAGADNLQLRSRLAQVWSQTEPANAASFVAQQIPPGPIQDEAAMSVLHQWGMQDYPGAVRWVQTFSQGPLRDRAFAELAGIANYLGELPITTSPAQ